MLEDALILGDAEAVAGLFHDHAVFATDPEAIEARGRWQIAHVTAVMRERGYAYFAEPRRIVQSGGTALVVAERAVNVIRYAPAGGWRYTISLINTDNQGVSHDTGGS